jgi:hypothetical protein
MGFMRSLRGVDLAQRVLRLLDDLRERSRPPQFTRFHADTALRAIVEVFQDPGQGSEQLAL